MPAPRMEMRYEPMPRMPLPRKKAPKHKTKEEQDQERGEVPAIYDPMYHSRNTIFKHPTTLAKMGGETAEGGSFTSFMNNFSSGVFKGLTLGLL